MAEVDYDAPRSSRERGEQDDSLELLQQQRARVVDLAESDNEDPLPPLDYGIPDDDELTAPVVPQQNDEFRCSGCFLVLHLSMKAGSRCGAPVCRDCL